MKSWMMTETKIFLFLIMTGLFAGADVKTQVVFGQDDRRELYQVLRPELRSVADSTVALISKGKLIKSKAGNYEIKAPPMGPAFHLCLDEPFIQQPSAASCSGFLVDADLIATAGHCVPETCDHRIKIVFDFSLKSAGQKMPKISAHQVYQCKKVIARKNTSTEDFALIQLDRPVPDHQALRLSTRAAEETDRIVVFGHPLGLPLKVAGGAQVQKVYDSFFIADTDTFDGNSGSAVMNAQSLEVVGILARGDPDFIQDQKLKCQRTKKCQTGLCHFDEATNISILIQALKTFQSGLH